MKEIRGFMSRLLIALVLVGAACCPTATAELDAIQAHSLPKGALSRQQKQRHHFNLGLAVPTQPIDGRAATAGGPSGVSTTAAADGDIPGAPAARVLLKHKHRETVYLLSDKDDDHAYSGPSNGSTVAKTDGPNAPASATAGAPASPGAVLEVVKKIRPRADR
jgi:hypothetical protein